MLFDTPAYVAFLVLTVLTYWQLPTRKAQNLFLLAASYFFYGWWDYRFLLLMAGSTAIDFAIARMIAARPVESSARRTLLIASLVINFSILGIFKYFNFFVDSVANSLHLFGVSHVPIALIHIILPPGISFYTFQEVAYIVDVYKGELKPAKSFIDYALFISLFPHLIAGPIQRPSHLLPQVQNERSFRPEPVFDGVMLILSGLFRKCVVADNCALIANAVFSGRLGAPSLAVTCLGMYAFAWQIYGDFSGYSDIARGSAQLLGFHFMLNFRQPYLATSFQEFWRRWHISLSTWLRDYLYIPLGGSAEKGWKTYRNLMLTMLLGGLWHGANWTFVVWGGIHGGALAVERYLKSFFRTGRNSPRSGLAAVWLKRFLVFHCVCLAWVFFRAESLSGALRFLGGLGKLSWSPEYWVAFQLLAFFTFPLICIDLYMEHSNEEYPLQSLQPLWRIGLSGALLGSIALFSANQANAFIYFQF